MNLLQDKAVPNEPTDKLFDGTDNFNQVVFAKSGTGMSFALNELNKTYADGKLAVLDVGASSADFLRQAAFARESLLKPRCQKPKEENT